MNLSEATTHWQSLRRIPALREHLCIITTEQDSGHEQPPDDILDFRIVLLKHGCIIWEWTTPSAVVATVKEYTERIGPLAPCM